MERARPFRKINSIFRLPAKTSTNNLHFDFLVDSGAAVSVLPRAYATNNDNKYPSLAYPHLYAANAQRINTYGYRDLEFKLSNSEKLYKWKFLVSDVSDAIVGADFLAYYDLLVDCRRSQIIHHDDNVRPSKNISQIASVIPTDIASRLHQPPNVKPQEIDTKHFINTGHARPIAQRCRRLFGEKLSAVKRHFSQLQNCGIIRPSKSPWASPLVVVKKSDGSYRPCGDYRKVNDATIPDRYTLPWIEDLLHRAGSGKIFTKIDLEKAYHQIRMNEDDIAKTAIITPFGLFEYLFMPFGLKCSAQSFQRHIDSVLRPVSEFCQCYIDDILIFSTSKEQHAEHVAKVLRHLQHANLKINSKKCSFYQNSVDFLGYNISSAGIKPIEDRIDALRNIPRPRCIKELQKFLGMIAFYHKCLPLIAEKLSPLYKLQSAMRNRKEKWHWSPTHEKAFTEAKLTIIQAKPLATPQSGEIFEVYTDASNFAIGATIKQRGKPIAYFSRALTDTEQKYSTFDKELLAIFATIKHFSYMIDGSPILISTDHKPILHLHNMKEPSQRQWRYINYLAEFNIAFTYIEGKRNHVADLLSRIPFENKHLNSLTIPAEFNEEEMIDMQNLDQEIIQLKNSYTKNSLKIVKIRGVLYDISKSRPRLVLPKKIRNQELSRLHSIAHPGYKATYKLLAERYVWLNMRKDVVFHHGVGQARLADLLDGDGGARQLHQGMDALLHASSTRRVEEDCRHSLLGAALEKAGDALARDRAHAAAHETE